MIFHGFAFPAEEIHDFAGVRALPESTFYHPRFCSFAWPAFSLPCASFTDVRPIKTLKNYVIGEKRCFDQSWNSGEIPYTPGISSRGYCRFTQRAHISCGGNCVCHSENSIYCGGNCGNLFLKIKQCPPRAPTLLVTSWRPLFCPNNVSIRFQ